MQSPFFVLAPAVHHFVRKHRMRRREAKKWLFSDVRIWQDGIRSWRG